MLDCKKKIKILDGVFVEKISDNEIVAINVTTGVFASVDEVGMKILQYINQPHSIMEITEMIKDEYDCGTNDIMEDVAEFIGMAAEEKFAERI